MIAGIIPARYASTRFPGKSLAHIDGKSMIQRVYEEAAKCTSLSKLVVATDDERILRHVRDFGGEALMTAAAHPTGTDRCWDALRQLGPGYEYVINIQGDEPFINPAQIDELAAVLKDGSVELATQMIPVASHEELFDLGEVKIVLNSNMEAMYFSRMVIPFIKGIDERDWHRHHTYYRHVGMYAYRRDVLQKITQLPVSLLEVAESLEQLRWLEHGFKIKCTITGYESHCIDTPEDIGKVLRRMRK
jgi:3-deoxy-manno-octulosonate cytidylyltransferase (CMP-KDO synthetase)